MIVVGPRWGMVASDTWADSSGLGLIQEITLKSNRNKIQIISNYWPVPTVDATANGAEQQLLERLRGVKGWEHIKSAHQYMTEVVTNRVAKFKKNKHSSSVVAGDFNADWHDRGGSLPSIQSWAKDLLRNNTADLKRDRELKWLLTNRQGENLVSFIDHILTSGMGCLTDVGVAQCSVWSTVSDSHLPLWAGFTVPGGGRGKDGMIQPGVRAKPTESYCDIIDSGLRNTLMFSTELQQIIESSMYLLSTGKNGAEAGEELAFLSALMVDLSRMITGSRQRGQKRGFGGWSPRMIAIQAHREFIIEVRRRLAGSAGFKQWPMDRLLRQIPRMMRAWLRTLAAIKDITAEERLQLAECSGTPHTFWENVTAESLTVEWLDQEHKRVLQHLHGAIRHEMRKRINAAVASRERARERNKLKQCHDSLLNIEQSRYEMDNLRTKEEDGITAIITDKKRIHNMITAHFKDWFAIPEHVEVFHELTGGVNKEFDSYADFKNKFRALGATDEALECVWAGINSTFNVAMDGTHSKADPHPESKFSRVLSKLMANDNAPSLEEFIYCIRKKLPKQSAPGPSGLSYAMLKLCSDEVLRVLYNNLLVMWMDKLVPDYWQTRFLVPIPKIDDQPSLNDLRPLMMNEVLRKIWTRLVVEKIKKEWAIFDILSHQQHGYLAGNGVEGAILQLINALETASENASTIYCMSWDKKRAFDSVAKRHIVFTNTTCRVHCVS